MMVYSKDSINDVQTQISLESSIAWGASASWPALSTTCTVTVPACCAVLSLACVVLCIYRNLPGHLQRQAVYLIAFSWCYVATSVHPPVNSLRRPKNLGNFFCPNFPFCLSEKLDRIAPLPLTLILQMKGWSCLTQGPCHKSHSPVHRSKMWTFTSEAEK